MTDTPTKPDPIDNAKRALQCLYITVDASVADDVKSKVLAAFEYLEAKAKQQGNGMPGEVPVVDENELAILSTTLVNVIADHAHNSKEPLRTKLCRHLRPYLRTPEPVTVSLMKCINAATEVDKSPFAAYRSIAKAVLESAKEQGAKFYYAD